MVSPIVEKETLLDARAKLKATNITKQPMANGNLFGPRVFRAYRVFAFVNYSFHTSANFVLDNFGNPMIAIRLPPLNSGLMCFPTFLSLLSR